MNKNKIALASAIGSCAILNYLGLAPQSEMLGSKGAMASYSIDYTQDNSLSQFIIQ